MKVAALYVEKGGAYYGLDDVDPWDEERDARLYAGPWPVVAHPPCNRWSLLGMCRGYRDGADEGCFEAALASVRRYGGVIEHPRHTLAWKHFGLPRPAIGGWSASLWDQGWATEVDQGHYGHPVHKPTWLYLVGTDRPPELRWGASSQTRARGRNMDRSRTPDLFRDLLLAMARDTQPSLAVLASQQRETAQSFSDDTQARRQPIPLACS